MEGFTRFELDTFSVQLAIDHAPAFDKDYARANPYHYWQKIGLRARNQYRHTVRAMFLENIDEEPNGRPMKASVK